MHLRFKSSLVLQYMHFFYNMHTYISQRFNYSNNTINLICPVMVQRRYVVVVVVVVAVVVVGVVVFVVVVIVVVVVVMICSLSTYILYRSC